MIQLDVSHDTTAFEVPAEIGRDGQLTEACARQACRILDDHGFVVVTGMLSASEAAAGLALVRAVVDDPERETAKFASSTDIANRRRDFCPLPSTEPVLSLTSMLCCRMNGILTEYCGLSRRVLEISTLTSYLGSSHQYIHRDPEGVLTIFAALEDVSPAQGGTVFVPGSHGYPGADANHGGRAERLMEVFQVLCNARIIRYNLARLWRMRREPPHITRKEILQRVFSVRPDSHQPNLLRFFLCKNYLFDLSRFGPRGLWRMMRHRKAARAAFRLVQVAPKKGAVVLYRSDMLHAGPDNRSEKPRYFYSLSVARDVMSARQWRAAYAPHSTLLARPRTLGELLDAPGRPAYDDSRSNPP